MLHKDSFILKGTSGHDEVAKVFVSRWSESDVKELIDADGPSYARAMYKLGDFIKDDIAVKLDEAITKTLYIRRKKFPPWSMPRYAVAVVVVDGTGSVIGRGVSVCSPEDVPRRGKGVGMARRNAIDEAIKSSGKFFGGFVKK